MFSTWAPSGYSCFLQQLLAGYSKLSTGIGVCLPISFLFPHLVLLVYRNIQKLFFHTSSQLLTCIFLITVVQLEYEFSYFNLMRKDRPLTSLRGFAFNGLGEADKNVSAALQDHSLQ
ncbi:hypothetical protein XENOCAPTIV_002312 [Xenoophorus captivus]|uniref:Uncharacterized protein n=1 Tax=Xenoophorus captivus TaxID=1517983 RepID=A0ABV0S4P5_9TELE